MGGRTDEMGFRQFRQLSVEIGTCFQSMVVQEQSEFQPTFRRLPSLSREVHHVATFLGTTMD